MMEATQCRIRSSLSIGKFSGKSFTLTRLGCFHPYSPVGGTVATESASDNNHLLNSTAHSKPARE